MLYPLLRQIAQWHVQPLNALIKCLAVVLYRRARKNECAVHDLEEISSRQLLVPVF